MRWYVVNTQPRGERLAYDNLVRQGFSVFLPEYLKRRHHARRVDYVRAPLFPRYLFVAMDLEQVRWRAIASTFGVSHIVCRGEMPAAVPVGVVEDIQAHADALGLVTIAAKIPYQQGEPVNVIAGAFSDRIGFFECAADEDRVILLLDVLGRMVRIKVPLDSVAQIG